MLPNELIDLQPTLRRIVRDDEDSLQDANLRLLQHADSIRNLPAYAARTAKRCRVDSHTTRRCAVSLSDDLPLVDPSPTPVEIAIMSEESERARVAVDGLPSKQREAIVNPGRALNSNRYQARKSLRVMLKVSS